MNIWQAIIMAIVEGVTEFLPISSTAHLMLTAQILKIAQTEFVKSFEIAIQLGAICSILVIFAQKLLKNPKLIWQTLIAFIPTGILGLVFYKFVKAYLLGNSWIAILAMFLGGLLLLKLENFKLNSNFKFKISNLLTIGLFQSFAMVPGVSRSLATIWGGQLVGLSRVEAVEMSFLLAVPTMTAATGFDLYKTGFSFTNYEWQLMAVGFGGAFVSALAVVKWLIGFVQKHDLKLFGWYRIVLAVVWSALIIFPMLP